MKRPIGVFAAICMAGFVGASVSGGCGDTERGNGNDTVDAGKKPDAGKTDGGVKTDGGPQPVGGAVGDSCTGEPGTQGDCAQGLTCMNVDDDETICTKDCTSATADTCGKNGTLNNVCATTGGPGQCLRGCDPADSTSCKRSGFVCWAGLAIGNVCLPDCRLPGNECEYGLFCDQQAGTCGATPCPPAPGVCPNGQVCNTDFAEQGIRGLCVNDCSVAGESCPEGFNCDATAKFCKAPPPTNYGDCKATGKCPAGASCLQLTNGQAFCFPECTSNACPDSGKCLITLSSSPRKFCLPNCENSQACPGDWTCENDPTDGPTCIWPQPAGTQQHYEVCDQTRACANGTSCIVTQQGATAGICLAECTDPNATCPGTDTCSIALSSGDKFCGRPCTVGAAGACPTGTTCKAQQQGATEGLCLP